MNSETIVQNVLESFEGLSPSSRLWIFQAERELSSKEQLFIESYLQQFIPVWTSHNRELKAHSGVFLNHFILVALDEEMSTSASGCSIDSMTNHIKHMSSSLDVDLMNRTNFYFLLKDDLLAIGMQELKNAMADGTITVNTPVINNLVKSLDELSKSWILPLEQSWHRRFT